MKKIIPITLLTGYLGAGKTTLLNYVLNNKENYKVAVIVNDIGEVNIDASLIGAGNVVSTQDDSLVPLQNGCICCTLKQDLMKQIAELVATGKFDYILIEASGICEPIPIVQSITVVSEASQQYDLPSISRLDNVVCVVDTLRLAREFGYGSDLLKEVDDEDIENLIIQQIEFCNKIILNKLDQVTPEEKARVLAVIKKLQPEAEIIEAEFGRVPFNKILGTNAFDFDKACMSAGWMKELEEFDKEDHHDDHDDDDDHDHDDHDDDDHDHDEHEHHGHHHHHHGPETEEYGISSFVYYRRRPIVRSKFRQFVAEMPRNIIRSKGIVWYSSDDEYMYIFEQAGVQTSSYKADFWIDALPKLEKEEYIRENPDIKKDWDEKIGDRMVKLVFIGKDMNKEEIIKKLDACLD